MADQLAEELSPTKRNSEVMKSFGYRLRNQFFTNESYRRPKELEWLESLRQVLGLYDPDVKIEPDASKVYPKITRSKINIALSRLHTMLFPEDDRNFEIEPTPEPSIDKSVVMEIAKSLVKPADPNDPQSQPVLPTAEELNIAIKNFAREAAQKMQNVIDDQLTEMDYPEETKKVLRSGLTYGTGVMKGPMIKKRSKRLWVPLPGGDYEEQNEQEEVPDLEFVRIWDWYPDMSTVDIENIDGSFQRHVMTKHGLRQMAKRDDFYADVIYQYLKDHPDGDYVPKNWEVDMQVIEVEAGAGQHQGSTAINSSNSSWPLMQQQGGTSQQFGKKYEVLEYWGYVDGKDLEACGVNIPDVEAEYAVNCWLLGSQPIKSVPYEAALGQYKVFYYEKDETSIFGTGLARVMRHSQLAIAGAARMTLDNAAAVCLTGDTEVYRNASTAYETKEKGKYACITLSQLWKNKHKKKSGVKRNKVRSVDEETGEIFFNRILDVLNNGIQPVYEVVTQRGYRIKATKSHRFLGEMGAWKELEAFSVGDLIAVNGQAKKKTGICLDCGKPTKGCGIRCRSCAMILIHPPDIDLPKKCIECGSPTALRGVRCRKCASKIENSAWNQRQAQEAAMSVEASISTAHQRWSCQKDKKDFCERCGVSKETGTRLDIHHKDRNPYNNEPENKITLCPACHMWTHARFDYIGNPFKHRYVDFDEIRSIRYVGEEEVFDLKMQGPNHNFVANGFISHNCGPQVEVNYSLMVPGTDLNDFYPRKIWFREGRGVDSQYPALRVYNIDSHITELLSIVSAFKEFGDEETTLPTWMLGQVATNETAQGFSGRMSTITISIKDIVKNFDSFTEHVMRDLYAWNMEFNPRKDIKGDYLCKARGSSSLILKELRAQALTQAKQSMQPEDWDYVPRGEFLDAWFKTHDLRITLRTEEEVQKRIESRTDQEMNQLVKAQMAADVGYTKAQTFSQLGKAKKANVEAVTTANTPPETTPAADPRLADAELQGKTIENAGKIADIQRADEQHQLAMSHADEKHQMNLETGAAKTAVELGTKVATTAHGMKMKEKAVKARKKEKKNAESSDSNTTE